MAWNDLTPEEAAWVARKKEGEAAIVTARQKAREYIGEHTCRWREEKPIINDYNGAEIYPDHPTCLLCGNDNDMELYCPESPDHLCHFIVEERLLVPVYGCDDLPETVTSTEILSLWDKDQFHSKPEEEQRLLATSRCIHCGDIWERSR